MVTERGQLKHQYGGPDGTQHAEGTGGRVDETGRLRRTGEETGGEKGRGEGRGERERRRERRNRRRRERRRERRNRRRREGKIQR